MGYKRKKTSTLDVLHPLARPVADRLVSESNIKKVLSAGVLALNDLPKEKQADYLRLVSNAESDEQKAVEVRQAVDTLLENREIVRAHIKALGIDAAAKLKKLFAISPPDDADRIRTAANALGPAAIAEGQADDDERAVAQAAAADVARTRDDNPLKLRKSS